MEGLDLLQVLVESTGLPKDTIERELRTILTKRQISVENLTLEELREVISIYLQEVLVTAKNARTNTQVS